MSDYVIEAGQPIEVMPQPEMEQVYTIKYTKVAKDLKGNDIEVVDDGRTETTTVPQLEAQKAQYQKMVEEIDAKLAIISKL